MSSSLLQLSDELATVTKRVWPSLVQVRNGARGIGAGTVVGVARSDGVFDGKIIVTNAHVVQSGEKVNRYRRHEPTQLMVQQMDGRTAPATVVAINEARDLAALTVDLPDLVALPLAAEHDLRAGTMVIALGFPWGVAGGATSGVVIEHVPVATGDEQLAPAGRQWLAASLHLRPGHSGGPMVNSAGELVGINTMMTGPDVGIAVPASVLHQFLGDVGAELTKASVVYL